MDEPATKSKTKLEFTGVQETLLATLYTRWVDFHSPKPILNDKYAVGIVDELDYNFAKMGLTPTTCAAVALRARTFDRWTTDFLESHSNQEITVLHLAAGFDTRALRLQDKCGSSVHWIDLDLPEVVEMRRKLVPEAQLPGGYDLIGADVTHRDWLASVPSERPTVVVLEGLAIYLKPEDMRGLVERLTAHLKTGQLAFDGAASVVLKVQWLVSIVKATGAVLSWALDDPHELETWHEGLKLKDDILMSENKDIAELPSKAQWVLWFVARMPYFRYAGRHVRYEW